VPHSWQWRGRAASGPTTAAAYTPLESSAHRPRRQSESRREHGRPSMLTPTGRIAKSADRGATVQACGALGSSPTGPLASRYGWLTEIGNGGATARAAIAPAIGARGSQPAAPAMQLCASMSTPTARSPQVVRTTAGAPDKALPLPLNAPAQTGNPRRGGRGVARSRRGGPAPPTPRRGWPRPPPRWPPWRAPRGPWPSTLSPPSWPRRTRQSHLATAAAAVAAAADVIAATLPCEPPSARGGGGACDQRQCSRQTALDVTLSVGDGTLTEDNTWQP